LSLTARLASAGKIEAIGSFQKATSIPSPKLVLNSKKAETGPQVAETESAAAASVSNSVTTTPKVTPSKSRLRSEEKQKTPHSSAKKSQMQHSPSNSKSTPNSRKPLPTQEEWSSPLGNGKRIDSGAGTIFNTDAEIDNFWDEDMSIEMITDAGDVDVDEEVRSLLLFSRFLSPIKNVPSRYLLRLKHFLLSTLVKFKTTSASLNAHKLRPLPNYTRFKLSSECCAKMGDQRVLILLLLLWLLSMKAFVSAVGRRKKGTGVVIEMIVMKKTPPTEEI
jgi:hypothetical protein